VVVEIIKCKDCSAIMVVDIKKLWHTKYCSTCGSMSIEKYDFNDIDGAENA
jgi:hypothetical protein